ncbi:hypothetical protein [Candidatus Endolissoclinum faulkneri]|uniref:hypothetical protein n=1 Tax=Candidatus Endolissoclinum faulkneri TaxID=1263979 RepID=UPI000422D8B0|nr:hypothetical protein [Candidatus Endolissoclinum faulkneri]
MSVSFFDEISDEYYGHSPGLMKNGLLHDRQEKDTIDQILHRETLKLVLAYYSIKNADLGKRITVIVKSICDCLTER